MKKIKSIKNIENLVKWFCKQLTMDELFIAAGVIIAFLNNKRKDIKCKSSSPRDFPNYRKFYVDPVPPFTKCPKAKPELPDGDYKSLLKNHKLKKGKELKPVKRHDKSTNVLNNISCSNCGAPGKFLYYNDGKKRNQIRCKVCSALSQVKKHYRPNKTKYWCPHCGYALFLWKTFASFTAFKCPNYSCTEYINNFKKLSKEEKELCEEKSSQFKRHYIYREYHFDPNSLFPAEPKCPAASINSIRNSLDVLSLALTFNISYGLSARQTAHILKNVFLVPISYQTVLNYSLAAGSLCHKFNLENKGDIDSRVAGDETYIRVKNKWNYVWFVIGTVSRAVFAYHLSDSRKTKHALITLKETIRTAPVDKTIEFIADGNPAYDAATMSINIDSGKPILKRRSVIGLKNDDKESEVFRKYKQLIERLNRTYKFHTRQRCGFKDFNGATALTVLFVTHYNFLRPHSALNYKTPRHIEELDSILTLQGRWCKILQMASQIAA